MRVALINNSVVENVALFESIGDAEKILGTQYSTILECPDEYGVGDIRTSDGVWSKGNSNYTKDLELRISEQEAEVIVIKEKLEITQAALDQLLLGGVV